jgi:hypothetical protein
MSLDRRLRSALNRAGQTVQPDTDERLRIVLDRGRIRRGPPIGLALVGAAAIVILVVGTRFLPSLQGPAAVPTSTSDPRAAVAGTYTVSLLADDPGVADLGIAGTWSITLHPSGAIDIDPPDTFAGSAASGHTFAINGDSFRTDLYYNDYCDSIASYRLVVEAGTLAFDQSDDTCAIRVALLAMHPWTREQ